MAEGRVLAASENGAYVLRLVGDVRLTLCASIEDYVDSMLDDPEFCSVWVDLCDAEGIDSTTLGQLAKLALAVHERYGFRPAIYCCDSGINRLLQSMGLDRLFEMHEKNLLRHRLQSDDTDGAGSEDEVRERVLEAHRVLMDVSEDNRQRFQELVRRSSAAERCRSLAGRPGLAPRASSLARMKSSWARRSGSATPRRIMCSSYLSSRGPPGDLPHGAQSGRISARSCSDR
jgi:anti-anti-sigma factor